MPSFWTSNELMRETKNHLLKANELQFTWFVITFIGKVNTAGNKANWFLWTYPISRTRRKERNHKALGQKRSTTRMPCLNDVTYQYSWIWPRRLGTLGLIYSSRANSPASWLPQIVSQQIFTAWTIGRIQHMDPRSMDLFVDLVHGIPRGTGLIFEDQFLPEGSQEATHQRTTHHGSHHGKKHFPW